MLLTCPLPSVSLPSINPGPSASAHSLFLCEMKGRKQRGWWGRWGMKAVPIGPEEGKPQCEACTSQVLALWWRFFIAAEKKDLFCSRLLECWGHYGLSFTALTGRKRKNRGGEKSARRRENNHKGVEEVREHSKWEHKSSKWDTRVSKQEYASCFTISNLEQPPVREPQLYAREWEQRSVKGRGSVLFLSLYLSSGASNCFSQKTDSL